MKVVVPAHLVEHLHPRMRAHKPNVQLLPMVADGIAEGSMDVVNKQAGY
jgi:hypothetical protein